MKLEVINLSKHYECIKDSKATLTIFLREEDPRFNPGFKRPAMIVVPGGGYVYCSKREGEPIALRFCSEGFNCFVLEYTCLAKYPLPQLELACAFDFINHHREEYLLTEETSIVGFSAGGHLIASYGLYYKELAEMAGIKDPASIKPSALLLSYPVITSGEYAHKGSIDNIAGDDESLREKMSVEKHITSDYPPSFVWTTEADSAVPPVNSKMLVEKLNECGVPNEFFIYKCIDHGASLVSFDTRYSYRPLNEDELNLRVWVEKFMNFYANLYHKN